MPFEIAPQVEAPARFANIADAILRGCAVTGPHKGDLCDQDGKNTCAYGAMYVGMGITDPDEIRRKEVEPLPAEVLVVRDAYRGRYGSEIVHDNDDGRFTREQIAERIRAL